MGTHSYVRSDYFPGINYAALIPVVPLLRHQSSLATLLFVVWPNVHVRTSLYTRSTSAGPPKPTPFPPVMPSRQRRAHRARPGQASRQGSRAADGPERRQGRQRQGRGHRAGAGAPEADEGGSTGERADGGRRRGAPAHVPGRGRAQHEGLQGERTARAFVRCLCRTVLAPGFGVVCGSSWLIDLDWRGIYIHTESFRVVYRRQRHTYIQPAVRKYFRVGLLYTDALPLPETSFSLVPRGTDQVFGGCQESIIFKLPMVLPLFVACFFVKSVRHHFCAVNPSISLSTTSRA